MIIYILSLLIYTLLLIYSTDIFSLNEKSFYWLHYPHIYFTDYIANIHLIISNHYLHMDEFYWDRFGLFEQ